MHKAEVRHNGLVDKVRNELLRYHDLYHVQKEVPYALGICDVLLKRSNLDVYFEVKYNHTKVGYKKALNQLKRWSSYMKFKYPCKDFIGVYVSKYRRKPVIKNGCDIYGK